MRKLCFAFISIWLLTLTAFAQGPSRVAVMAYTNGNLITPTNFFASNLLAGANVSISIGASGKVTIATIATNVVSTNFSGLFVTNFVEGTNYTWYFATNVPRGIVTFEWLTNLLSTVGTNVAMLTNGNQFQGVPLSIKAGFLTTNANIYPTTGDSGTNIVIHLNNASTRTEPILQIIDDTTGNATFTIGDDSQLNGNGYGLSNLNGVVVMPGTINSNAIDAALDALYRAGSLAVTTNYVHGAIQTYVGLNATNVFVSASTFHTNWANAVSNLTVSLILTNSTNIIYVSPRGNDATWVRGRQGRPCSTLSNAVFWSRAGDTIVMEPGWYTNYGVFHGRLNSNAPVLLTNKTDLTILADGARMYWPTGMMTGFLIYQSSNVTIKGLSLVNNRTPGVTPSWASNSFETAGVFGQTEVIDSTDCRFLECRWIGSLDHGLLIDINQVGAYGSTRATTNCEVSHCYAEHCGQYDRLNGAWDGAGIIVSHGWKAIGNTVRWCGAGIEDYPYETQPFGQSPVVVGNMIVDCITAFAAKRNPIVLSGNSAKWTASTYLTNYVGNGAMGAFIMLVEGAEVVGNTFEGASDYWGLQIVNVTNSTIAHNTIKGGARGIQIDASAGLKISENQIADTTQYGWIIVNGLNDCVFAGNDYRDCATNNPWSSDINYVNAGITVSNLTFRGEKMWSRFSMPRSISLGAGATSTNIVLEDNQYPAAPAFPVPSLLHERSTNRVKMLLSATPGQVWTATNANGFGTWSNSVGGSASATNAVVSIWTNGAAVAASGATNINFVLPGILATNTAGNVDIDPSALTNGLATIAFTYGIGANATSFVYSVGANTTNFGYGIGANATSFVYAIGANVTNHVSTVAGKAILTNIANLPAGVTGFTNTLYGSASVTFTTNAGGTVQLTASGTSSVGTNFYNAEVSNSVRSLNGFFTNLTVYSDFTVSNLSAVSFTLSNIAPGLAYFSTADTNLASLPTGAVGKILMSTNGSSQYAWVDMPPVTNGPNWTVAGGNWGHPAAVVINFNDTTNMPWSIMCSKPSDTLTIDFNAMTDGRIIQWSNTYLGLTFDGYSAYTNSGSVAFAGDMGVKSNLTVAGNLTVNGTNSVTEAEFGTLTVTNAVNLGTTYVARFIISNVTAGVAYFDSSYILTNLAHATGVLTNNASGVMGWGTPFVNADTTVSNGLVGWTVSGPSNTLASATTATTNGLVAWVVSGPSNTLASATTATTNGLVAWVVSGPSNTLSSATTATTNGLVAWVVSGPSNTLRTDLSAAITAHTNLPQASVNTLDVTNNVSYLVGTSNALDNTGLTNISLNFNQGAMRIYATNSLILTNCVGLEAGEGTREKNLTLSVVVSTVGSVTNMFPTLGADSTGVHFYTNANNYVSTTLTNVGRHIYTLRAVGTNVNITYTHWK